MRFKALLWMQIASVLGKGKKYQPFSYLAFKWSCPSCSLSLFQCENSAAVRLISSSLLPHGFGGGPQWFRGKRTGYWSWGKTQNFCFSPSLRVRALAPINPLQLAWDDFFSMHQCYSPALIQVTQTRHWGPDRGRFWLESTTQMLLLCKQSILASAWLVYSSDLACMEGMLFCLAHGEVSARFKNMSCYSLSSTAMIG